MAGSEGGRPRKRAENSGSVEQAAKRRRGGPNGGATADRLGADEPLAAAHQPDQLNEGQEPAVAAGGGGRREVMTDVARRRAAHFANFRLEENEEGAEGDDSNVHVGGSSARTLGPWSSAVELVEQRASAAEKRAGRLAGAQRLRDLEAVEAPWTPPRDVSLGLRTVPRVPTLFALCVSLLVQHSEDVESLMGLPDAIKVRIAEAVCRQRRLSPAVAALFGEGAPGELSLPNCTQLQPGDVAALLRDALTPRLERLQLGLCGRGLTDDALVAAARAAPQLPSLRVVALSGAYRMSDRGVTALLEVAPGLVELRLPLAPLVTGSCLQRLPTLAPQLRVLDLDQCRAVSAESLREALPGLPALQTLVLNGIQEVCDQLLADLACTLPALQDVHISQCSQVSDAGVRGLAVACPALRVLHADDCVRLTDGALAALAEHCPCLQELSLSQCARLSDEAVARCAERCSLCVLRVNRCHRVGPSTLQALASFCRERLQEVDLSWCRRVSDNALGRLVDACPHLRTLALWGCSQVSSHFLAGHGNGELRVLGRGEELRSVAPL